MAEDPIVDAVDQAEDEDRVTLGQRIAGLKQPSAMPVTTPSGADVAAPDVRPPVTFDPNSLPEAIRPKQLTPEEVPSAPTGSNNPNLAALAKQQATLATPINPYDQTTEKIKPQYRMGLGQRILGTAGNFLSGFGGDRSAPVNVGPGAVGWRYGREERARQGALEGVNTQIGTQEKLDTENEKLMRDAMRQAYEGQVGAARGETAAAQRENADTRRALEASQAELNQARAGKAEQVPEPKTEAELALAYQTALQKKDTQAAARYKGALDELARQKRSGRDTSASDVSKAIQVAEYRGKEHDRIDQQQENERRSRYAEVDKDVKVKFSPEKTAAAKAQIDADLKTKYDPKHQNVDDQADKMLGITKSGGPLKSTNKPAPTTTPAKPSTKIDPNNLPKTVQIKQKDGTLKTRTVAGYNKQTGKVILAPEGQ